MKGLLDSINNAPIGQGLFCENFKDASENPPFGSELLITENLLFNFLTEDGLNNLITE